ncbi:bifunctional biotin-protein ligase/biotin operon repressor [Thermococcus kodakarensis KOD1]|uniref:Bifunctional biotin-protein ligase/biotin operon repressor n=1 Tax=Thermococcus kodakarensis (strain ATCC BAA-918 / JCM 12380 / KOD1) TaxID=69014 RepID=Q5JHD3_THEKO|nr:biotin--[acetyl-CoA-carboxylase] ligase [Thermococcus kodakarensis]WCN28769.1 biotin--[acetyl-CoA-carboxylase] ligase [Thermococcus kodakarensis]WCN31068.1 biotin--[acetyl-CoA-carboxylase] ligase [Thermococcus kodakarensis]BAD84936.1 bifunctional biotin-protein ligase/biotin operon repressor [Thermococcus kodakarensis KOD1]
MRLMRDSAVKRRILAAIEDGPVSGEKLAEGLGISRVAVWKHIRELKRLGYKIEASHAGYFLRERPDVPYPWELPVKAYYLEETSSTMDVAWKLAERGRDFFVIAGSQKSGRGRKGSRWLSPPGGLWFSLVASPELSLSEAGKMSKAAREVIAEYLQGKGIPAEVSENGVFVHGKKIAGVLVEVAGELDAIRFAVVGVGINVKNPVPEGATSMALELGDVSLLGTARELLPKLLDNLKAF